MFVDSLHFFPTGLQSNFALFIIVFALLLSFPVGPYLEKDLPDFIDGLAHPQGRGIFVAWLTFLVVKSDTCFPLLGDADSKEMAPSNIVLVDIGIVDGLVEDLVWVIIIIICWQSWYKIWW